MHNTNECSHKKPVECCTVCIPFEVHETGPWTVDEWPDGRIVLQSQDFTHDAALAVSGDFGSMENRRKYAEEIARRLNTTNPYSPSLAAWLLSEVDEIREKTAACTASDHKSRLGQFFTPLSTAKFMAGLFVPDPLGPCSLLDAGAGVGSLTSAFLARKSNCYDTTVHAFEVDPALSGPLKAAMGVLSAKLGNKCVVHWDDFIEYGLAQAELGHRPFTHAILNPPYRKLRGSDSVRRRLKAMLLDVPNTYAAFVALALELLVPGGQMVAVVPRSFCNGPYYRSFRKFLLDRAAIRHLHLFESRDRAFASDGVKQENVILHLTRGGDQGPVTITSSFDASFSDLASQSYSFDRIVFPSDKECFIRIPSSTSVPWLDRAPVLQFTLLGLGLKASTGPIVDFRLEPYLQQMPGAGTVPLLFAGHCKGGRVVWPQPGLSKPNAIRLVEQSRPLLYPNGYYCVVRRISLKEDKRRIVASVVTPDLFGDAEYVGFDNRLNVLHIDRGSLPETLAYGLTAYLSTTLVDEAFRQFSGHTQVNVADLHQLRFPSQAVLEHLGEWFKAQPEVVDPAQFDEALHRFLSL